MAQRKRKISITYSFDAIEQLKSIWIYNATHRGTREADQYERFLLRGIDRLETEYGRGKQVADHPELRYVR